MMHLIAKIMFTYIWREINFIIKSFLRQFSTPWCIDPHLLTKFLNQNSDGFYSSAGHKLDVKRTFHIYTVTQSTRATPIL